ncbi:hypothetical protein J437_LFUL004938, partial [Ladona fulva]
MGIKSFTLIGRFPCSSSILQKGKRSFLETDIERFCSTGDQLRLSPGRRQRDHGERRHNDELSSDPKSEGCGLWKIHLQPFQRQSKNTSRP